MHLNETHEVYMDKSLSFTFFTLYPVVEFKLYKTTCQTPSNTPKKGDMQTVKCAICILQFANLPNKL